jgi:hypothetical protein
MPAFNADLRSRPVAAADKSMRPSLLSGQFILEGLGRVHYVASGRPNKVSVQRDCPVGMIGRDSVFGQWSKTSWMARSRILATVAGSLPLENISHTCPKWSN